MMDKHSFTGEQSCGKNVQAVHHDFRFKRKKQMQNEYPHDIFIN